MKRKLFVFFIFLLIVDFGYSNDFRINFDISVSKGLSNFFSSNSVETDIVNINYENKMKVGYLISADFPIYKNIYLTPCFGVHLGFQDYSKFSNIDNELIVKYEYDFNFVFEDLYLKYDFLMLNKYLILSGYFGFGFNQINHNENIDVNNNNFFSMIYGGELYFLVFKNTYLIFDISQRLSLERGGISLISINFGISFKF